VRDWAVSLAMGRVVILFSRVTVMLFRVAFN